MKPFDVNAGFVKSVWEHRLDKKAWRQVFPCGTAGIDVFIGQIQPQSIESIPLEQLKKMSQNHKCWLGPV